MDQNELHYCRNGHILPTRGRRVEPYCPTCGAPFDPTYQPGSTESSAEHEREIMQIHPPQILGTLQPVVPTIVTQSQATASPTIHTPVVLSQPSEHVRLAPQVPIQPSSPSPVHGTSPQVNGKMSDRRDSVGIVRPPIVSVQQSPVCYASGVHLSYFGQEIDVPSEETWLGREGLGAEWFDGNLNISRHHVKLHADGQGGVSVGPDASLNGTSHSTHGCSERAPISRADSVVLHPGDILWVYNIPLEVK